MTAATAQARFAKTKAERTAKDDPRPSLEERYPTQEAYVNAVRAAANELKAPKSDAKVSTHA